MWAKTSVLLVLMILSNGSALVSTLGRLNANATRQVASGQNLVDQTNKTPPKQNATTTPETLESAPTITSVHHQVWTSSSSGRLDELSPEVISKLRNDVPFLAAYALRPRLVGAPSQSLTGANFNADPHQPGAALASDTKFGPSFSASYDEKAELNGGDSRVNSPRASSTSVLQVGASAPQAARQSLVPKLGEFSEFNVETSSLSKSEHHHKRRTSLRRPQTSKNLAKRRSSTSSRLANKSNRREDSLSQLMKRVKQRRSSAAGKRRSSSNRRDRSRKGSRGRRAGSRRRSKQGKRRRSSRRSSRSSGGPSSSQSSRFLQQPDQKPTETNELETADLDRTGTKGGGDVKGGSASGRPRKTPFYAAGQRPKNETLPGTDTAEAVERNLETDGPNSVVSDTVSNNNNNNNDDDDDDGNNRDDERTPKANDGNENNQKSGLDSEDDGDDGDSENEPAPKRVGDDDVEEDGDTVLVEPKSDGVDDDPPLPSAEDEADGEGGAGGGAEGDRDDSELPTTSTSSPSVPQGDPRGNRVNRQKPNEVPASSGGDDGQDQVAGGGVGATVGGGGGSTEGAAPTDGSDKDRAPDDEGRQAVGGDGRPKVGGDTESGVEFADEGRRTATDVNDARDGRRDEASKGRGFNGGFDENDRDSNEDGNFGERNKNGPTGPETESQPRLPGGGGDGTETRNDDAAAEDDDKDLDYRDEMERTDQRLPAGGQDDDSTQMKEPTTKGVANSGHGHSKEGEHCDDGSYDHSGDHHHHHHDTIDWLRGSIPGEPNEDYPILSRANATNFSCADQKHPGYYADVDARCQIFHICQADGRQDSFLCPNGTIFSQKSLVCVWWNGFHCEDAPKFYHLNELLYKSANGNESPQTAALPNLRPLDGAHLKPRSMMRMANDGDELASVDEDDSPIDSPMRGRRPHSMGGNNDEARGGATNRASSSSSEEGTLMRGQASASNNIGPDDDATIQRKSTNLGDDSVDEPQARLRARSAAPRRRRRASTRQAPPKLKSRRVSRNSRRRKLRHGIKPRRRA